MTMPAEFRPMPLICMNKLSKYLTSMDLINLIKENIFSDLYPTTILMPKIPLLEETSIW